MGSGLPRLRVFISSPGDVAEERVLANKLVRRLSDEYANRLRLDPVFWEHEPLLAHDTFQNQIPRPSESEIVVCILWNRMGTRLPPEICRPDGSRYASGTEFEFEDAVEGRRRNGFPDLLVYRKTADPVVSLADRKAVMRRLEQREALEQFLAKWFINSEDGSLKAAFHSFHSGSEFEQLLERHLLKLIERRLAAAAEGGAGGPESPAAAPPSWTSGSPFRGLEAFDFEHAPVFFGRTRATVALLDALRRNAAAGRAFALLVGVSGGGKSSMVRAGLLPLLTQAGVVEGVALWRRAVMRPSGGADPFVALAAALVAPEALPELAADGTDAARLADLLRHGPSAAFALVKGGLSQAGAAARGGAGAQPEVRLALVVDQLEELFTAPGLADAGRERFVAALSCLARSGKVWVVATLRGDFYHRCFELPELVALQEGSGQYALPQPTAAEVGQLIRQPARAAGLRFAEDRDTRLTLDETLREAAGHSPESLPLLEFALDELYKRRSPEGLLTFDAYRAIGGVEGALARRAEAVYESLPPDVRAAFPRVMRALVDVAERDRVTARQASLAERGPGAGAGGVAGAGGALAEGRARAFVDAFVAARLFAADRTAEGGAAVRVTHEALLRKWDRAAAWIEQNKELLIVRARVAAAAARWAGEGRRRDMLLGRGKPLEEAESLAAQAGDDLSATERQFISASAALARSRGRLKRGAIAALAVLAVTAATAAGYANHQSRLAARNELAAGRNAAMAEASAARAEELRRSAQASLADRLIADADARAAASRWGESVPLLADAGRLFRELKRRTEPVEYRVWESLKFSPPPLAVLRREDAPSPTCTVAVSGDGRVAVTGHADGSIVVWDVVTRRPTRVLSLPKAFSALVPSTVADPYAVNAVALSPDGRLLLSGGKDLRLTLWDLSAGSVARTFVSRAGTLLFAHGNSIRCVAFSRDGKSALSGGWGGEAHAWDLESGKELWSRPADKDRAQLHSVAFTSDGRFAVVAARGEPRVPVYDARYGREAFTLSVPEAGELTTLAAAPDPDVLAVGDLHGGVRLLSVGRRAVTKVFAGHTNMTTRVQFAPDGRSLVSAGRDGLIRFWDLATGQQSRAVSGDPSGSQDIAVSGDGRFLVATSDERSVAVRALSLSAADVPVRGGRVRGFPPSAAEVSHDGRLGALAGGNGIDVFDLETGMTMWRVADPLRREQPPTGASTVPLRFAPDDSSLVWGDDTRCGVLDLAGGAVTWTDLTPWGALFGISEDAGRLAIRHPLPARANEGAGGDVLIVDRQRGRVLHTLRDVGPILRAEFLPADRVLLTVSRDKREQLVAFGAWTAQRGVEFSTWQLGTADGSRPDDGRPAGDRSEGGRVLGRYLARNAFPADVAARRDDGAVLAVLGDGGLEVLAPNAASRRRAFDYRGLFARCGRLTHGGRVAAVAADVDQPLRLWDFDDGTPVATLAPPALHVTCLGASDDGRWLVLGGRGDSEETGAVIRDFHRAAAFDALPHAPALPGDTPEHLAALGLWYALQGIDDWAVTCLRTAGPRPASGDDALILARCLWRLGDRAGAADGFQEVLRTRTDPADLRYLRACLAAVRRPEP